MFPSKTMHNEQIEEQYKLEKVQKLHKCCYGNDLENQLRTQTFQKLTFHQDFEFLDSSLEIAQNIVKDYCQARNNNQVRVKIVRSSLENNKKVFQSEGFKSFIDDFKLKDSLNTYYIDEHRKLLEKCLGQKEYYQNQSQSTNKQNILQNEYYWIDQLLLVLFKVVQEKQRVEDEQNLLQLCDKLYNLLKGSEQDLHSLPMYQNDSNKFLQFQLMISEAIHLMQFGDLSPAVIFKNTVFPAIYAQFNPVIYTIVAFLNSLNFKQGAKIYHQFEHTTQQELGQKVENVSKDNTRILIVNFSEHEHTNNLKVIDMLDENVDNLFYISFFEGKHDTEELKQKYHNRFTIPLEKQDNQLDFAQTMYIYRAFLKKKLREFDPTICILTFTITDTFHVDQRVLSSFTSKLYKLSHSRLIIIPRLIKWNNTNGEDLRKFSWTELNIQPPQKNNCEQNNQTRPEEDGSKKCNNQESLQDSLVKSIIATINGISFPKQTRNQQKIQVQKQLQIFDQISDRLAQNEIETQLFKKQREIYTVSLKNNDMEIEKEYPKNQNNILVLLIQSVANPMNTELQYLAIENEQYQKGKLYTDKNAKYLVDYIGRNIVLINGEDVSDQDKRLYHIKFTGITKYQIESITDITQQNQQSLKSVYSIHNNRLYEFYGIEDNLWQYRIKIYDFNQKNWFVIQPESRDKLRVLQDRVDFAIVPQFFVDIQNQSKCNFAAIGGTYASTNVNGKIYNNIIEHISIDNYKQTFTSDFIPKEKIQPTRFKETANPLVLRLDESNLLYFEGIGKNMIQSFTPNVLQITTFGKNKVNSQVLNPNKDDPEQQELFIELCQLGSTTQYNYIKVQQNQTDFQLQIIFQELLYKKQKYIDENQLLNQGKKEILQITQFNIHFKSYGTTNLHLRKQVYQSDMQVDSKENLRSTDFRYPSWLQQLSDTTIVNTSTLYQYMLCFTDTMNVMQARQFLFDDVQNRKAGYDDYQEVLFADYKSEIVVVARKSYNNTSEQVKHFQIYYCPFINLQDVRDTIDNSLQKVELIPVQLANPIVKDTGQLLGICSKGNEYMLLTQNQIYYFDRNILDKKRKYEIQELPVQINFNIAHTACVVQSDLYTYTFYQQGYNEKKIWKGVLHYFWYLKYYVKNNDKQTSEFKQYDLRLEITDPADSEVQLNVNNVIIVKGQIVISLIIKHSQVVDLHRFNYTQALDGQLVYKEQMLQGSFQTQQVYKQIFGNHLYSKCGYKDGEQNMKLIG